MADNQKKKLIGVKCWVWGFRNRGVARFPTSAQASFHPQKGLFFGTPKFRPLYTDVADVRIFLSSTELFIKSQNSRESKYDS
jgi:hypothetical protein